MAFAYRHGSKDAAEQFFMDGMGKALGNMHDVGGADDFPVTIYYAFKQAEVAKGGTNFPRVGNVFAGIGSMRAMSSTGRGQVRTELAGRTSRARFKRPRLLHCARLP